MKLGPFGGLRFSLVRLHKGEEGIEVDPYVHKALMDYADIIESQEQQA